MMTSTNAENGKGQFVVGGVTDLLLSHCEDVKTALDVINRRPVDTLLA
jgi:hypothetical protein